MGGTHCRDCLPGGRAGGLQLRGQGGVWACMGVSFFGTCDRLPVAPWSARLMAVVSWRACVSPVGPSALLRFPLLKVLPKSGLYK